MTVAFDAGVLSLLIFPGAKTPFDFRTGQPITHARQRIEALIDELDAEHDTVLIPAPALCEALVPVAEEMDRIIDLIESQRCFRVTPFDKKTAIELALRCKGAIDAGDKKEGIDSQWQKVKYDRQIVAISKTEGASILYALDRHIHHHAKLWGIMVMSIADLDVQAKQGDLYDSEAEDANAKPVDFRGGRE